MATPEKPDFYDDLDATLVAAWQCLETGVRDRKSGFHTVQLGTVGVDGFPSVRTAVLRAVDREARWAQIHTDRRGPKPVEIAQEPRAAMHVYDAAAKIQIRLTGHARLHTDDEVAATAWAGTRRFSRECYQVSPAPGTALESPRNALIPEASDSEAGGENFAVLRLYVVRLEWLYLAAAGHRRAVFDWSDGACRSSWLVP